MKAARYVLLILTGLIIQSCAVGNKYALDSVNVNLDYQGKKEITVASYDARPYIRNRTKSRNFIGLQRGGFGNPFDVTTASQNSLADDMSHAISSMMQKSGYTIKKVNADQAKNEADAVKTLVEESVGDSILLVIDEWKSDRYSKTSLYYDLTMKVLGHKGNVLGQSNLAGKDILSGSPFETVPVALGEKLKQLLSNPDIKNALQ